MRRKKMVSRDMARRLDKGIDPGAPARPAPAPPDTLADSARGWNAAAAADICSGLRERLEGQAPAEYIDALVGRFAAKCAERIEAAEPRMLVGTGHALQVGPQRGSEEKDRMAPGKKRNRAQRAQWLNRLYPGGFASAQGALPSTTVVPAAVPGHLLPSRMPPPEREGSPEWPGAFYRQREQGGAATAAAAAWGPDAASACSSPRLRLFCHRSTRSISDAGALRAAVSVGGDGSGWADGAEGGDAADFEPLPLQDLLGSYAGGTPPGSPRGAASEGPSPAAAPGAGPAAAAAATPSRTPAARAGQRPAAQQEAPVQCDDGSSVGSGRSEHSRPLVEALRPDAVLPAAGRIYGVGRMAPGQCDWAATLLDRSACQDGDTVRYHGLELQMHGGAIEIPDGQGGARVLLCEELRVRIPNRPSRGPRQRVVQLQGRADHRAQLEGTSFPFRDPKRRRLLAPPLVPASA